MNHIDIPQRANRALNVILIIFILILIRIWYLCVVQYDLHYELAKKPQKKTTIEKPSRGTIRDRFGIPFAVNQISYQATVVYDPIRQIPRVRYRKGNHGKKEKYYPRKEYIASLSLLLADELGLNQLDIEDILYSQASLFPNTPFVIQDELSEKTYYKLKSLERKYLGLQARMVPKRFYPRGKTGGDIIGYTGMIDQNIYSNTQSEIKELEEFLICHESGKPIFLPVGFTSIQEIKERLLELKSKAYKLSDTIGKTGIEKSFDDDLRGYRGKKHYEVDTKGHYVRMLPGSKSSIPGRKLLLNLSSELQEHAEALLAENELIREKRFPSSGKDHRLLPTPWIKGGAIVAIIPKTGEVVALASYPRMDPNDFVQTQNETLSYKKKERINRFLESPTHIEGIWNGTTPLTREFYDFKKKSYFEEEKYLTLSAYLDMIFSAHSDAKQSFERIQSLNAAFSFQRAMKRLLDLSEQPYMSAVIDTLFTKEKGYQSSCFDTSFAEIELIKEAFSQHEEDVKVCKNQITPLLGTLKHNDDKLLTLDLCTLVADETPFYEELTEYVGPFSLQTYRKHNQAYCTLLCFIKDHLKKTFHEHDFLKWREENFKAYLKQKRQEEKERKTYQRPYLEYLLKLEKVKFREFFEQNQHKIMHALILKDPDLYPEVSFHVGSLLDLDFDKVDTNHLERQSLQTLSSSLDKMPNEISYKYLRTMRGYFDLKDTLYGYYPQIKKRKRKQKLMDLASSFYPYTKFGYGRSYGYRQSTPLGSIFKVITAYEAIAQNFEKGAYEGKDSLNPLTIIDEIHPHLKTPKGIVLGYHEDGKKITRRYKGGTLPRSHAKIGKIDYFKALERSSNIYFSLLASDVINEPNDLVMTSLKFGLGNKTGIDLPGEIPGVLPKDLNKNRSGLYAFAIGQHSLIATPVQTSMMLSSLVNGGEVLKPQILRQKEGAGRDKHLFDQKQKQYPYDHVLNRVGIFFPFFIETQNDEETSRVQTFEKTLYRRLYLPKDVKNYLLESLHNVISSPSGNARAAVIRYLYGNALAKRAYLKLKHDLAGKTSTAEIAYNPTLDRQMPPIRCQDIWFGGVSFYPEEKGKEREAELCVVVYLKFGDYGKEAAPLAGEIVSKWREIQAR